MQRPHQRQPAAARPDFSPVIAVAVAKRNPSIAARAFSLTITGGENSDGSLFPVYGNRRELCTTLLKVKTETAGSPVLREPLAPPVE